MHIVSAGRLDDKTKDNGRTLKLIDALDRYCKKTGRHYIWTIFSNPISFTINSPNVVLMKPRTDVRPYMADSDYVVQLSNDMETYCYTINEALEYGVPVITTPLTVMNEFNLTDDMHITLDWNCENVDEVARLVFEKEIKPFRYEPPKDNWEALLVKEKSTYKEEKNMRYLVEATDKYKKTNTSDNELSVIKGIIRYIPNEGEQWEVELDRKDTLEKLGFVKVIKEIKEVEVKTEKEVKATRKRTKKEELK